MPARLHRRVCGWSRARVRSRPQAHRRSTAAALAALVTLVAACSTDSPLPQPDSTPAGNTTGSSSLPGTGAPTRSTTGESGASLAPGSASSGTAPASTAPTTAPPTTPPSDTCAAAIVDRLTPDQRVGQLLMVGLDANAPRTSLDRLVARYHLGGVILLGGWYRGADSVRATTSHLAGLASPSAIGGLGMLIAADQEGGAVQQLRGDGFDRMPSARRQSRESAATLTRDATTWARQLSAAGIYINLAPVADTVPASIGRANQPIGRYDRQFSSDPTENGRLVSAFVAGMHAGRVAATVKHFPGLGRITGNTDVTATGITDRTTTTTDPYLSPFVSGIRSGVDLVMVGSAIYSRIDPGTNAVFSRTIVTDLLRGRLGYEGVVITDDVGAAKAVSSTPTGERATRFVDAGGDIVLTAIPSTVPTMHAALTSRMAKDPAFAKKVEAAATRVVNLKLKLTLARCD